MILVPLIVASVGTICTYFITQQQVESAKKISEAQVESAKKISKAQVESAKEISKAQRLSASEIADSDRQIQLLEIFSKHITSSNKKEQQIALEVLEAMDDGDLTEKLATAVAENETDDSNIKQLAEKVANASLTKGYWFAVIGSYRKIKDAKDRAEKLPKSDKYTPEIYRSWNFYYAVTLGGYLSHSEAKERVKYAINKEIAADAYPYKTRIWGKKLVD